MKNITNNTAEKNAIPDTILVVDDDAGMRDLLSDLLTAENRTIITAASGRRALELIKKDQIDLVLTDINMPDMNGIELIQKAQEEHFSSPIITITAYASTETAIRALRAGAYDYITKPFAHEELLKIIDNTLKAQHLFHEVNYLRGQLQNRYRLEDMIGQCPQMQQIFDIITRMSQAQCNVLITGQSGTGKELVAKAIHENSSRKDQPFIPINCASIPMALMESELFGHIKGAFTGAIRDKQGLLATADGGTVFLDEIGDMPLALQVKLLRVLQSRQLQKVGSTELEKVDIRIIAATNQDLMANIKTGSFREDLYYRLKVVEIKLPALKDRGNDITLLASHFLKHFCDLLSKKIEGFSVQVRKAFEKYPWPGNVRELENAIERAVTFCQTDTVELCDIPANISEHMEVNTQSSGTLEDRVTHFEKQCLQKTLINTNYDLQAVCKQLGVSTATLYRKVKKYNLSLKPRIIDIPTKPKEQPTYRQMSK